MSLRSCLQLALCLAVVTMARCIDAAELVGSIVDSDSGKPIAARVYLQDASENWLFVESTSSEGSAIAYREQWVPMPTSVERHTTTSAHSFRIDLSPGEYQLTVERGKEYFSYSEKITIGDAPVRITVRLQRWVNMARRGWYSGETHVHRRIEELPNVMMAEDLNVTFPVTFWTTKAFEAPGLEPSPLRRQGPSPFGPRTDRGYDPIKVDATHVMFPRNTEYEIFSVGANRHVLGAIFVLNHKTVFRTGMPPVAKIAEQAHREGALLDLDKHSWPWSMMLVPIARVDLYELSNNSVWRTNFGFRSTLVEPARYMSVESNEGGMTEWGWLTFGFENYYALLSCGFRLSPTAGTASGVHPVPLGYSRVYVQLADGFDANAWIDGLRRGRSFVTTGPMLFATLNDSGPGAVFEQADENEHRYRMQVEARSQRPLEKIEIIVNGLVANTIRPTNDRETEDGPFVTKEEVSIRIRESSWVAVRAFQRGENGRIRFAHTAPWHIEVANRPIRPRRVEVDYLVQRMQREIDRNKNVLPEEALAEFERALEVYERIRERAAGQ